MRLQNLEPTMLAAISEIRANVPVGASSFKYDYSAVMTVMRASAESDAQARADDKLDDKPLRDVNELAKPIDWN